MSKKRTKLGKSGQARRRLKAKLSSGQNHRCGVCSSSFERIGQVTIDHMMPSGMGGANSVYNAAAVCEPCNKRRGLLIENMCRDGVPYGDIVWMMFGECLTDDVY